METKGHYFIVGIFTITLTIGMLFFAAWLMGVHKSYTFQTLVVYFPGNVSGIDSGSAVKYRGLQVGRVDSVSIDPDRPEYLKVVTQVDIHTPLRESTQATLQNQGITGLSFVELETDNKNSPLLTPPPGTNYLLLYGQETGFTKIIKEVPVLLERYTKVADQLLLLLNQKNIDALTHTFSNLEAFTGNLAQHQKDINQFFTQTEQLLKQTQQLVVEFRTSSATSFSELDYFLRDSRQTAIDLQNLAKSLEENPSKIIYQPSYHGYKVNE